MTALWLAAALLLPSALCALPSPQWRPVPATGVEMSLRQEGTAVRVDFDFRGRGGYAIARREGKVVLPENFELSFRMKAEAPRNTLEVKFIRGEDVWWSVRRDLEFPREWKRFSVKKRNVEFAWGPGGPAPLPREVDAIEIVVTAGTGGRGTVWLDDVAIAPLETAPEGPLPKVGNVPWRGAGPFTLDLGARREIGALIVEWDEAPPRYSLSGSIDGKEWEVLRRVEATNGGRDALHLPDGDARLLRLDFERGAIRDVRLLPPLKSDNEFFAALAAESPRGVFPRYLLGQQAYWTVIGGTDGESEEALLSEDGAVEAGDARFTIEPFLLVDGKLVTWNDVAVRQGWNEGGRYVEWVKHLTIRPRYDDGILRVRYAAAPNAKLFLAVRPFQVNTPWQFLRRTGGTVRISSIARNGNEITVEGDQRRTIVVAPSSFGATTYDGGDIVEFLRAGSLPPSQSVTDPNGFASAAMGFEGNEAEISFELDAPSSGLRPPSPPQAGEKALAMNGPASPSIGQPESPSRVPSPHASGERVAPSTELGAGSGRVRGPIAGAPFSLHLPAHPRIAATIDAQLEYILINRDGPSIQPGSRSYERSWIRDGSLTSAALLRLGRVDEVREFIEWYAKYVDESGYVPCCVSPSSGADPVPEHDSHGQLVYLIAEYVRHTGDLQFAERHWPLVERVVHFVETLRAQRMTKQYRGTRFFGLVPESISHEGYSAKAMHSYWDDFFVLRGLKDAAWLAQRLGRPGVKRYESLRDDFRRTLVASIEQTIRHHGIDFIPGSADLGDFDATSTTVAISPVDEAASLPQAALRRTFDRYLETAFEPRGYTPYELRTVGTLVRLRRPAEARALLDYFFEDQRPAAWLQWAEGIRANPREPHFVGDMPHTWVGSDFIRSALDFFAFEEGDRLVVAAGVSETWARAGVRVSGLRTWYGPLEYSIEPEGEALVVRIGAGVTPPPGGIAVVSPLDGSETVVRAVPAEVRFARGTAPSSGLRPPSPPRGGGEGTRDSKPGVENSERAGHFVAPGP